MHEVNLCFCFHECMLGPSGIRAAGPTPCFFTIQGWTSDTNTPFDFNSLELG